MQKLKAKLQSNPHSRCAVMKLTDCANQVKNGDTVFIFVLHLIFSSSFCSVKKKTYPFFT